MIQRHNEKKAKKASLQQRIQNHYNHIQGYPQQPIIQRPIIPIEPVQKPVKQEIPSEPLQNTAFQREDSSDKLFSLDNTTEFDFLDDFLF